MEEMKLLPIPGLSGYRVCVEELEAYKYKYGNLIKITPRTKYKIVSVQNDGATLTTTIYRMAYCAKNGIDITKLPSNVCISLRNGVLTALTRQEIVNDRFVTNSAKKRYEEVWKKNIELIDKFYNGDTQPLLEELKRVESNVSWWFIDTYGLSKERAEICSAYGVNRYLDRIAAGFPSPHFFSSVKRYALSENNRMAKNRSFADNMNVIDL